VQLPELGWPCIVALRVAVQPAPAPSLTDTLPEGLIEPVPDGATVTLAWTCCPTTADAGLKARLNVVVPLTTARVVVPELAL